MSDWEDFCKEMGADPGSSEDSERMLDLLPGMPNLKPDYRGSDYSERKPTALRFGTFQEAAAWAKSGKGRVFTRTSDGKYFVPKEPASTANETGSADLKPRSVKRMVWPSNEANSSGWLPGSYPRTKEEEKFSAKDSEELRYFFYPTIERLAPHLLRPFNRKSGYLGTPYIIHGRLTNAELIELLSAIEWRLVRCSRWHTSQRDYLDSESQKAPPVVVYWDIAIQKIQDELSRRGDEAIKAVQEELSNKDAGTAPEEREDRSA